MTNDRVVHISTVHKPYDTRIFLKECTSLAQEGYEVFFLVPTDAAEQKGGVNIVPLPRFHNPIIRILFAWVPAFVRAVRLKGNVYHFHDPELIFMGLLLSFTTARVVYDVHEDYELQILNKGYIPKFLRPLIARSYKIIERICLFNITSIITVTEPIAKKYKLFGKKNAIIRNFPIVREFHSARNSFMAKESEVCYVGGVTRIRGIFDYVNALEYCGGIRLNLGGDYSNNEKELRNLVGWSHVNKYGFVNRAQINEIFSKSKIGLVVLHPRPNYIEALPVKMFEYMAAGLPVICSNFPTYEKIIKEHDCGSSVEPSNPVALAERILELINDEETWNRMSQNAIRAVEQHYSWEKEANVLLGLYEILLLKQKADL